MEDRHGSKRRRGTHSSTSSRGTTESSNQTSEVDEGDTEGQRSSDDLSAMKLGPWFNGKPQTLDRNTNLAFPTSVYLDKLEGEKKERRISTNSDDTLEDTSVGARENQAIDLDAITSANTQANEAELPQDELHRTKRRQRQEGGSVGTNTLSKSSTKSSSHDHKRSHHHKGSISKHRRRHHRRPYEDSSDAATIYSNQGSFRFLNAEEIDKRSASDGSTKKNHYSIKEQKQKEHQKIQWSDNDDRLI